MELFKKIEGYNFYFISNKGKVKSFSLKNERFLKLYGGHKNGYISVGLSENGIRKTASLSRLVATAFVPNPLDLPEVNHLDGNKFNNNDWNLEWSTRSDNEKHAYRIGLKKAPRGQQSKLATRVGRYLDGKLVKGYPVITEAIEDGFSRNGIRQSIETGCLHFGFEWKYLDIRPKPKVRKILKPICSYINNKVVKTYNRTSEMINDGFWVSNVFKCLKNPEMKYKKLYWKYA